MTQSQVRTIRCTKKLIFLFSSFCQFCASYFINTLKEVHITMYSVKNIQPLRQNAPIQIVQTATKQLVHFKRLHLDGYHIYEYFRSNLTVQVALIYKLSNILYLKITSVVVNHARALLLQQQVKEMYIFCSLNYSTRLTTFITPYQLFPLERLRC